MIGKPMKKALYLLLLASGAAAAGDDAVLKCRALTDGAQRLACYDAMPLGAPAAAAPGRSAEQNFGMTQTAREPEPDHIESSIVGDFDGWTGNSRITLANGQVWRITDGSEAVLPRLHNPKVRITRGLLGGAMYFKVDGQNSTARVRRVQ
jgi:hypothetical protein